jgi:hypothetical protein
MSRRTLPARRLAVAALAPLALTTLVACGGDDAESTASDTAAETESDAPAEDGEEGEAEPVEAAAGEEIETSEFMDVFESAFDDATTVHMTMDMKTSVGDMTGEGDADYSATPPAMDLTISGGMMPGEGIKAVMVDGIMYMQIPGMGADETYFELDLSDPNNPLGSGLTSQLDPKAMFEQFEDSVTSVTYEGEQDVDGDTADAYAVTVDAAAVLESQGMGEGEALPPGLDVPEQFTYNVYFADEKFRRMEIAMGETLGEVTLDFTDWGKDVSIEAPPADQVQEFPDLGAMMPTAGAA